MTKNSNDYSDLRTLLDSLEVGALRFYLSGPGPAQPKRLRYLKKTLMPIIDKVWHPAQANQLEEDGDCPPGFYNCNGVCVPYPCPPGGGLIQVARKKAKAAKKR